MVWTPPVLPCGSIFTVLLLVDPAFTWPLNTSVLQNSTLKALPFYPPSMNVFIHDGGLRTLMNPGTQLTL